MNYLLKNANVFIKDSFFKRDVLIKDGKIADIGITISNCSEVETFDFNNKFIFPGFVDVHVHLREPGFILKENIETGTKAAARGGYTTVCSMPNLNPVPDSFVNLKVQLDRIKDSAKINVVPFGSITVSQMGETLSDMEAMAPYVAGFSDDGKGVQSDDMMRSAMLKAKQLDKIISAHCEVNSLLFGGCINDCEFAKKNNIPGICNESEWKQIERDIALAKETGCKYHVCHISTKESVALIRKAKADNVDITCETAPHYLVLDDTMLENDGRFKMNPPLRSPEDRQALIEGIKDGTIDMIATDHAPHTKEEKSKGLVGSLMGIVGIETSFSILYTKLVKKQIITLEELCNLMSVKPSSRFGFDCGIEIGKKANLTVFDTEECYAINTNEFLSMGKCTPFDKWKVHGKCLMTISEGEIVWKKQ